MDIIFHVLFCIALSIVFMAQTSQYLQMWTEEMLIEFLSKSMVSKKFANLCKFGKYH